MLVGAASAQADSGSITDVNPTPYRLTFNVHVDWSSCWTNYSGTGPYCDWTATVRAQDPDTECTDVTAGSQAWLSQRQKQPGVVDAPVTYSFVDPGQRLTLCLWIKPASLKSQWTLLAKTDVQIADIPVPPPMPYSAVDAKAVAVQFISWLGEDTNDISATCAGGLAPVCTTSWADRSSHWRGKLTLSVDGATFAGEVASNTCLKRHRPTCWKPAQQRWGDA